MYDLNPEFLLLLILVKTKGTRLKYCLVLKKNGSEIKTVELCNVKKEGLPMKILITLLTLPGSMVCIARNAVALVHRSINLTKCVSKTGVGFCLLGYCCLLPKRNKDFNLFSVKFFSSFLVQFLIRKAFIRQDSKWSYDLFYLL